MTNLPNVAVLIVSVQPKAASVTVTRAGSPGRVWDTRSDGRIEEELEIGVEYTITASALGYVTSTPKIVWTFQPGLMPLVEIVLEPVRRLVPEATASNGKFRLKNGAVYVPRWRSLLTALTLSPKDQANRLASVSAAGFDGVRVFAGALTWARQTPDSAVAGLAGFLDRAAVAGLIVEVTALTDTITGYDAKAHVKRIAQVMAGRSGVFLELMNEVGHPTQDGSITVDTLRAWARELVAPLGVPWAVGAPIGIDEVCPPDPWVQDDGSVRTRPSECLLYAGGEFPGKGGDYSTSHLGRKLPGDEWNEVRRVRELYEIPALNNEAKGCAEEGTSGQRYYDPAFAFALGALDRAFGIGGVHHSEAGLRSQVPGPTQQACEAAYVAAHAAVDAVLTGIVGRYLNVGHSGSPLLRAVFVEGGSDDGVVRAYSFVAGDKGVTILLGLKGDAGLVWGNGWRVARTVDGRTAVEGRQVIVLEIFRHESLAVVK